MTCWSASNLKPPAKPAAQLREMYLDQLYILCFLPGVAISCETDDDDEEMRMMMNHNLTSRGFKDNFGPWWLLQPTHQLVTSHCQLSCCLSPSWQSCRQLGISWVFGDGAPKTERKTPHTENNDLGVSVKQCAAQWLFCLVLQVLCFLTCSAHLLKRCVPGNMDRKAVSLNGFSPLRLEAACSIVNVWHQCRSFPMHIWFVIKCPRKKQVNLQCGTMVLEVELQELRECQHVKSHLRVVCNHLGGLLDGSFNVEDAVQPVTVPCWKTSAWISKSLTKNCKSNECVSMAWTCASSHPLPQQRLFWRSKGHWSSLSLEPKTANKRNNDDCFCPMHEQCQPLRKKHRTLAISCGSNRMCNRRIFAFASDIGSCLGTVTMTHGPQASAEASRQARRKLSQRPPLPRCLYCGMEQLPGCARGWRKTRQVLASRDDAQGRCAIMNPECNRSTAEQVLHLPCHIAGVLFPFARQHQESPRPLLLWVLCDGVTLGVPPEDTQTVDKGIPLLNLFDFLLFPSPGLVAAEVWNEFLWINEVGNLPQMWFSNKQKDNDATAPTPTPGLNDQQQQLPCGQHRVRPKKNLTRLRALSATWLPRPIDIAQRFDTHRLRTSQDAAKHQPPIAYRLCCPDWPDQNQEPTFSPHASSCPCLLQWWWIHGNHEMSKPSLLRASLPRDRCRATARALGAFLCYS